MPMGKHSLCIMLKFLQYGEGKNVDLLFYHNTGVYSHHNVWPWHVGLLKQEVAEACCLYWLADVSLCFCNLFFIFMMPLAAAMTQFSLRD